MMKKLSQREEQVIDLLKQGSKNREIALKLEVDQKTISTYVDRIRRKLGVHKDSNVYVLVRTYLKLKHQKPVVTFEDFKKESLND